MSRLDSAIRRLEAQRDCLAYARELVSALAGPVFELGLGNGRTYDHLRELFPGRDIRVFERKVAAHPDCIPPADKLFLGDYRDTFPAAVTTVGAKAALVHADTGCGNAETDRETADFLSASLPALLMAGGVVLCDLPLTSANLKVIPLPSGIPEGRYYIYQHAG